MAENVLNRHSAVLLVVSGTDLGGFQGAEGAPWASQGVPGTPCGLRHLLSNEVAATFLHFNKKYNYFLVSHDVNNYFL